MMRGASIGWFGLFMGLAMSRAAVAQHPVNVREPFPIQEPPPELPTDVVEAYAMAYALATPMVELDPALPALDIEAWLNVTLWEKAADPRPAVWMLTWCEDLTSDHPGWGTELCAEAAASVKESRMLRLHVKIGEWRTSTGGEGAWVPLPREFRRLVIEELGVGTLDVRLPSELTKALDTPVEKWPKVDLKVGIEATPPRARPHELVTVTFRVHNAGPRDAARVQIHYSLWVPADAENIQEFEWFPRIPAGHTAVIQLKAQLPYAQAMARVSAGAVSGGARESDGSDNHMSLWVQPADKP